MKKNRYSYEITHSFDDAKNIEPMAKNEETGEVIEGIVIKFELYPTIHWDNGDTSKEEPMEILNYYTGSSNVEDMEISHEQLEENVMSIMKIERIDELAEVMMDKYESTLNEGMGS